MTSPDATTSPAGGRPCHGRPDPHYASLRIQIRFYPCLRLLLSLKYIQDFSLSGSLFLLIRIRVIFPLPILTLLHFCFGSPFRGPATDVHEARRRVRKVTPAQDVELPSANYKRLKFPLNKLQLPGWSFGDLQETVVHPP